MVHMRIEIEKPNVKSKGETITEQAEVFDTNIKAFEAAIDKIDQVWEGSDALKTIKILRDTYVPNLNELAGILKDYGKYLEQVPGVYTELDTIFTNKRIDV